MRYILGVIGMIILGVIAVMLFARTTTNRSGNVQTGEKSIVLTEYINNTSEVEFTQYGQITANEERRTLKIYVSETGRRIEVLDGYEQVVERSQAYTNNRSAYESFLNALDTAGFTRKKESEIANEFGACPSGRRFVYTLENSGQEVSRLWNNSCQPQAGTLGGNGSTIRTLFQNQIPDYSDVVKGISF